MAVLAKICTALNANIGDILGRIYEYFLNKFAKNLASDDGVFFTSKSLVKMIVNVLEPKRGILLEIIIPKWIQGIEIIKKCAFAV